MAARAAVAVDSRPVEVPVARRAAAPARPDEAEADRVVRAVVRADTAVVPAVGAVRAVLRSAGGRSGVVTAPSSNRLRSA